MVKYKICTVCFSFLLILTILTLLGSNLSWVTNKAEASSSTTGTWRWQNPLPQGEPLYGIWGNAPDDIFAVGDTGIILHYDGWTWRTMNSNTPNGLYGIWGSSHNNVFAVGMYGTILYYNGSTWAAMDSGTSWEIYDIWGSGPDDIFAVGQCGTILHYNGNTWKPMSSGTINSIYGVWGSAPDNVFGVSLEGENTALQWQCMEYHQHSHYLLAQ